LEGTQYQSLGYNHRNRWLKWAEDTTIVKELRDQDVIVTKNVNRKIMERK
jgi:hypothetical protein